MELNLREMRKYMIRIIKARVIADNDAYAHAYVQVAGHRVPSAIIGFGKRERREVCSRKFCNRLIT